MHSGGVVMNCSEEQARAGKGEQQADCKKRCLRCGEGKKPCLVTGWGWRLTQQSNRESILYKENHHHRQYILIGKNVMYAVELLRPVVIVPQP